MEKYKLIVLPMVLYLVSCNNPTETTYEDIFKSNDSTNTEYTLTGKIIYYVSNIDRDGFGSSSIHLLNLSDYSTKTIKTFNNSIEFNLSVSNDNHTIAYVRRDLFTLKDYLTTIDLDSANYPENIISRRDSNIYVCCPGWTHDNKLAYLHGPSDSLQLVIQENHMLLDRNIYWGKFAFTDDGTSLFYSSSDDSFHVSLYKYDLNTHLSELIVKSNTTFLIHRILNPSLSPDGKRILFIESYNGNQSDQIWVADLDGTNMVNLKSVDGALLNSNPTWSIDGNKIAFLSFNQIYIMNSDGSDLIKLNNTSVNEFDWID